MSLALRNFNNIKIFRDRISLDKPILLNYPEIDGVYFDYDSNQYVTYVGLSLSAYGGLWDLTAGPQTLIQEWWDWSTETLITSTYATNEIPSVLSILPEYAGKFIGYVETAIRDGISEVAYTYLTPYINLSAGAPIYWNNLSTFSVSANHRTGIPVARPVYQWTSLVTLSTTRGEWYKNDIPTGVSTYTYSNTSEGDTLYWSETAYNVLGNYTTFMPPFDSSIYKFYVSNKMYDYVNNTYNAAYTRTSSISGGSKYMNLFSTKNHNTNTYIRNSAMWLYDISDYLASVPVYKGGMTSNRPEDYGGVLITPKHLLYCRHAHPYAENTWVNPSGPCIIKFIKSDNTMLSALQIHQYELPSVDMCVAVLDRNMQDLGLHPIQIINRTNLQLETLYGVASSLPQFAISQGYNANNEPWNSPISDYPLQHDVMCYIKDLKDTSISYNGPFKHMDYAVYDGDSGTTGFVLSGNKIYVERILTSTPWAGNYPGNYISQINNAINMADLSAVNIGRLSAVTGYTVSAINLF